MQFLGIPFLTEIDPRDEIKGSRDPLGAQLIWMRFGRTVVGNLTTVSSSLRDFTTLMLGYYFAEKVTEATGQPSEKLNAFLRWEQLAAYARLAVNNDGRFRGIDRVQEVLNKGRKATLSAGREHQILSNQKIYGLWGLYSVPAIASGLLEDETRLLTAHAREFVESFYLPILAKEGCAADKLTAMLSMPEARIDLQRDNRLDAVAKILRPRVAAAERILYRRHLIEGGSTDTTDGRQAQLAKVCELEAFRLPRPLDPTLVRALTKEAHGRGHDTLADRLERIRVCDSVLAPATAAYVYLLGMHGKPPNEAAKRFRALWGERVKTCNAAEVQPLRAEFAGEDSTSGDRWVQIAEALADGDYGALIGLLMEQNRRVMAARGGASWLVIENGRFTVRFQDEQGSLPSEADLPGLWRYPYFIDSLRSISAELRA